MSQAPITGIIMLFEMTGDYKVVLPLMVVCVISSLVTRGLYPETIYTEKLMRRGLDVRRNKNVTLLGQVSVSEVMTREVVTLDANMGVEEVKERLLSQSYTGYPVMMEDQLAGIITYEEVLDEIKKGNRNCQVGDIVHRNPLTVYPEDSIRTVMDQMAKGDVGRLPVVDADDPAKLVGIISRSDIINAYTVAINKEVG
ncbi:MAG: CBS domain-containing protein [Bacillota bacterium]|nr:CBS domain-containing protein [Bacillota bacterium]